MPKIIVVSDGRQKDVLQALKKDDVKIVETGAESCMAALGAEMADCVVLCVGAAGGERILGGIKAFDDALPVVVIGVGSLEDAVQMMKLGASDCLRYPVNAERLQIAVANAVRIYDLTRRFYLLENQVGWSGGMDNIIGHSQKMQDVFRLISTVSKSNATVLILGESGTGKELVAKAIHKHSPRCGHSFVDINCGAIPHELLENELFGHERGAYTGADRRYIGCCERAGKGTLFLDEICEMEPSLQVKILRLLQERTFTRVGGLEPVSVDIRFIAATNKDISEEVRNGRFREDLFYRLNVVQIAIPPLRDRREDVPILAKYFLEKFSAKNEKVFSGFDPDVLSALAGYDWPGNVRELENVIERVVVLHNDSHVKLRHLPPDIQKLSGPSAQAKQFLHPFSDGQKIIPLEQVERYAIESALAKCLGNVSETAKQLKVGQATLYRKIKEYGFKT